MQSSVKTYLKLSSLALLGVLLLGCSTQSKTIELRPEVRIPDLPSSVRYTEPKLPVVAKDAKETSPVLEAYEKANEANRFAIEQAQKERKRLQKLYNKPAKKKPKTSSWSSFSWPSVPNPFSIK